jgi:ketosteroid isomerase-like protein
MPDLEANKKVVRRFFECLSAGDADALLALYADDVQCWTAGDLPFSGLHPKEELRAMIEGVVGVFPEGWRFSVKTLTAEDDRVAAEAEVAGKHVGGRSYEQRYHFLFWVRDGRIRRFHEYFDTKHAADVLLSAPAPGFSD